ncbi:hypothetical protein [Mucilaginibacter boryungensis]|uniref:YhhN-like protein n=1 Tax=Mucilaginibacter boryungensis TaxID=768480 RepID=A0ABR9XMG3_9SPHI|nr:hypothetical protein [Mucilaginibacter boryungensis]MBE9668128.1 hypothetical protein [Mucilaginibacter boryungensis]
MNYYISVIMSLSSSALPVLIAALRYKMLDKASRIIFYLLTLAFLTECVAAVVAYKYRNNLAVYNVSNLGQVFLIALYFNYCSNTLKRRNIGLLIGLFSIVVGVLNMWFLQPIKTYNSNYFLYQTLIVLALGMFVYTQFLLNQTYLKIQRSPHFWFILVLFFFYVFNFFTMSLYDYETRHLNGYKRFIDYSIAYLSATTNIAFTLVFLFYPRLKLRYVG